MPKFCRAAGICLAIVLPLALAASHSHAAATGNTPAFPSKPVRVVTGGVGGGADLLSRLIAQSLTTNWGQQVIVDNRSGASGAIAARVVATAPPDGYTMLLYAGALWIVPLIEKAPWDPLRDFAPITLVATAPNILVVHPTVPAKSVQELIALAKAKPGELNYASGVTGSSLHLGAELFKHMAGVNIVRIPFKGAAPALNAVIGGQVQMMFSNSVAAPHVKAGRLRALAVTSAQPSKLIPGLPTVAASGLTGYESVASYGLFASAATPAGLIQRLNQDVVRVLNQPETREKILGAESEVVGNTPQQFVATIKAEMERLGRMIREAGIRSE